MNTSHTIEQVVRDSYSRLVAYLAARFQDVAAAEDALSDAMLSALETWPSSGVPAKPEAWLLTAARRRLIDQARKARTYDRAVPSLIAMAEELQEQAAADTTFPDERLKLLFICAHPAIDSKIHTPLMLQTVLGLDAARIAASFLLQPSAMGQRLSRAKAKIRDARIKFEIPDEGHLPSRLAAVLEAIYAAYGIGWDDVVGADHRRKGLTEEAIYLGRLMSQFMPEEPEVKGLLSLMLHCEARRNARRTPSGRYVPLSEQDTALWSREMMEEAENCLKQAFSMERIGRFQLEAAIQSAYAGRAWTGRIEWDAIAALYEGLVRLAPTIGALVGHAAAVAEAKGAEQGFAFLQQIPAEAIKSYQPYWALAAHLLARLQRTAEAETAYGLAIGLCRDEAMREFLVTQAAQNGIKFETI